MGWQRLSVVVFPSERLNLDGSGKIEPILTRKQNHPLCKGWSLTVDIEALNLDFVQVILAVGCSLLTVVFGRGLFIVRQLTGRGAGEDHLSDSHAGMEANRSVTDVVDFEGYLSRRGAEAGVDETGGDVYHHSQSSQAGFAGELSDNVVGKREFFEGGAEDELFGVDDDTIVDHMHQTLENSLGLVGVDYLLTGVMPGEAVSKPNIIRVRLNQLVIVGFDGKPAVFYLFPYFMID